MSQDPETVRKYLTHWQVSLPPGTCQECDWRLAYAIRFDSHTWKVEPGEGSALVEIIAVRGSRRARGPRPVTLERDDGKIEGDRLVSMPIWGVVPGGKFVPVGGSPNTCQEGVALVISIQNTGRVLIDVTYALLTVGLM